jgi:toluene monooxygenase system protein E
MADSLRWVSHTAYRTRELSRTFADKGFGEDERRYWEEDAAWQGFRELMERTLTVWDWGEAIVVLSLVVKAGRRGGRAARWANRPATTATPCWALLTDAQLIDAARHRRWATALVKMALKTQGMPGAHQGLDCQVGAPG